MLKNVVSCAVFVDILMVVSDMIAEGWGGKADFSTSPFTMRRERLRSK
jgi:hypothetical protein